MFTASSGKLDEQDTANDTPYLSISYHINGHIDDKLLQEALQQVAMRHTVLSTGIAFTYSSSPISIDPHYEDISKLCCATLLKLGDHRYQFHLALHPDISNLLTVQTILNDTSDCYNALLANEALPEPTNTLSDELNPPLSDTAMTQRLAFWKQLLSNPNPYEFPVDYPKDRIQAYKSQHYSFRLHQTLIKQLQTTYPDTSLEHILLAGIYSLLFRYSEENDLCLGYTINHPVFNIIPLRLSFAKKATFQELIENLQGAITQAQENQLPLTRKMLKQNTSQYVVFRFDESLPSFHLAQTTAANPVVKPYIKDSDYAVFETRFNQLADGSCQGSIRYNTHLHAESTIARLIEHLTVILTATASKPTLSLLDTPLLLPQEKELLQAFNNTDKAEPPRFFPNLFNQTALTYPDQIAVKFHGRNNVCEQITYNDLNRTTNQLARIINSHVRDPRTNIGICLSRSINLMTGIVAGLKSGHAIVPLETSEETEETRQYKIGHSQLKLILVDDRTESLFKKPYNGFNVINLQAPAIQRWMQSSVLNYSAPAISARTPAYIMYTPGTTGKPKGVMQTHDALSNLAGAFRDEQLTAGSKVLCTALPTFDAFLADVLAALVTHGELHLTEESERFSVNNLDNIIARENIHYFACLPKILEDMRPDSSIDYVTSMGDVPNKETLKRWKAARPERRVINGLGHTETGICLTLHSYKIGDIPTFIGHPIRNMRMYILNPNNFSLCPIGVQGELFVAGPGVTDGYLGQPELSKTKFPLMLFNPESHSFIPCEEGTPNAVRMFQSGDFARYQLTLDGKIDVQFIGRKDRRIKLNGVRVQLDNIESALRKHPGIKDVVLKSNTAQTQLIAYIIAKNPDIPTSDLRKSISHFLKGKLLQGTCHPRIIVCLNNLSLTTNGKINTQSLPNPYIAERSPTCRGPEADNALQQKLLEIFAETLDIPANQIDFEDKLEDLGADSFSTSRLTIALQNAIQDETLLPGIDKETEFDIGNAELVKCSIVSLAEYLSSKIINTDVADPNAFIVYDSEEIPDDEIRLSSHSATLYGSHTQLTLSQHAPLPESPRGIAASKS